MVHFYEFSIVVGNFNTETQIEMRCKTVENFPGCGRNAPGVLNAFLKRKVGLDWIGGTEEERRLIQSRGRQAAPRVNMHKPSHHAIGEIFVGIWEKMPCVFEQPFVFMAITLQGQQTSA